MRDFYYGLGDGEAWAVMSHLANDPNPPVILFETAELAERYRQEVAGDEWEVVPMEHDEIEYHAERSGNRIMLCTKVSGGRILKVQLTLDQLRQRLWCN